MLIKPYWNQFECCDDIELQTDGESSLMKSFIIYIHYLLLVVEPNEGGAYVQGMQHTWNGEKYLQNHSWKFRKEEVNWKTQTEVRKRYKEELRGIYDEGTVGFYQYSNDPLGSRKSR